MTLKAFQQMLDRPIAFQRSFMCFGGTVASALLLSQAVYWSPRTSDPEGWFYKSRKEWEEETGLTRSEQEDSRRRLRAAGVLEEMKRGVPCRLYYRVRWDVMESSLQKGKMSLEEVLATWEVQLKAVSRAGYARAVKAGVTASQVAYADVLRLFGMACHICGMPIVEGPGRDGESLAFQHVLSVAKGGAHTLQNLRPAHASCNAKHGSGEDNEDIPVGLPLANWTAEQANQQVGYPLANWPANGKQTITETTTETTPDIPASLFPEPPPDAPPAKKAMPPKQLSTWQRIIDAIDRGYVQANGVKTPWTDATFGKLKRELAKHKSWGGDEWVRCIENRYASQNVNLGESPETFIPKLKDFVSGALNRFGKTGGNDESTRNDRPGRESRIDRADAELLKSLEDDPATADYVAQRHAGEVREVPRPGDDFRGTGPVLEGVGGSVPRRR